MKKNEVVESVEEEVLTDEEVTEEVVEKKGKKKTLSVESFQDENGETKLRITKEDGSTGISSL